MNRQIIAIGGGGFGRKPGEGVIENYILQQAIKALQAFASYQQQLVIMKPIKIITTLLLLN